jgi:hypothetical protein
MLVYISPPRGSTPELPPVVSSIWLPLPDLAPYARADGVFGKGSDLGNAGEVRLCAISPAAVSGHPSCCAK